MLDSYIIQCSCIHTEQIHEQNSNGYEIYHHKIRDLAPLVLEVDEHMDRIWLDLIRVMWTSLLYMLIKRITNNYTSFRCVGGTNEYIRVSFNNHQEKTTTLKPTTTIAEGRTVGTTEFTTRQSWNENLRTMQSQKNIVQKVVNQWIVKYFHCQG